MLLENQIMNTGLRLLIATKYTIQHSIERSQTKGEFNITYTIQGRVNWTTIFLYMYIHTYIIEHYNPSVRIIDLVFHTTYVVCVNFISGGTFSLKSTPNDKFFGKLFMAILVTLRVFARNLMKGNHRRNTFRILF